MSGTVSAVLLWLGVAVVLLSCAGMLLMRDVLDRLHFTAPATTLGPVLIAVAVVLRESFSATGLKTVLVAALLIGVNPVLTHATARAARIRRLGDWKPAPGEEVERP
jgi:multicomponent Na+:H+ antiporter subunit G